MARPSRTPGRLPGQGRPGHGHRPAAPAQLGNPEGDKRSVTELEADEVGASLKWATAKVERTSQRGNDERSQGRERAAERGGDFSDPAPFSYPTPPAPPVHRVAVSKIPDTLLEQEFDRLPRVWTWHDPDLGRPIAAPLERCAELLGVDLATICAAAGNVEPYLRADGTRIWSLMQLERQLRPEALRPAARRVPGPSTNAH